MKRVPLAAPLFFAACAGVGLWMALRGDLTGWPVALVSAVLALLGLRAMARDGGRAPARAAQAQAQDRTPAPVQAPDPPVQRLVSPDGMVAVEFVSNEARMSHWIDSPRVTEAATGSVLLDLWEPGFSAFDASPRFEAPGTVTLRVREYPGTEPGFTVAIDARARTFAVTEGRCPGAIGEALRRHLRETPAP